MPVKLNPKAAEPVRTITTVEGKFLSLQDMKARLGEEGVLDQALAMLAIGHESGDDPREIIRRAIGEFVVSCAGEPVRTAGKFMGRGKT